MRLDRYLGVVDPSTFDGTDIAGFRPQSFKFIGEEFARKARVIAGAMQFLRRGDSAVPLDAPGVRISDNWRALGMRGTVTITA